MSSSRFAISCSSVKPTVESLARQARAVERESVQWTKYAGGDLLRAEKIASERLHIFARDGFDGSQNFVECEKTAEIKFLACEIRHARACGFERKHERTLEMVLRAKQFLFGNGRFLQGAKFGDG